MFGLVWTVHLDLSFKRVLYLFLTYVFSSLTDCETQSKSCRGRDKVTSTNERMVRGIRFEIILIAEASRFSTFHSVNWSVRPINQTLVMESWSFVDQADQERSLIFRLRSAPQSCHPERNNNFEGIPLKMDTFVLEGLKLMAFPRKLTNTILTQINWKYFTKRMQVMQN